MRWTFVFALLFTAAIARGATVTFVSPLQGSQAIGLQLIEVTTTAQNIDRVEFYVDGTLVGVARVAPWGIAHDFGTLLDSHTIMAKVLSNGYRTTDQAQVVTAALTAAESIDVDIVEVPLRARSNRTITAADLRISENRVDQTIRDVRPERGAARFVFVIDRSLSMGDGKLTAALNAVDEERKYLRPDDTVAVVLFNHNVSKARTISRDEKIANLFGEVVPSGGTSMRDAVASMISSDRTYAIVITDGGDRHSELSEEEALQRVSGTRTVADAIVLDQRSPFLDKAAKNTGGEVVEASRDTLRSALHDLILDINSRYLVVYQSHGTKRGWRTIDVKPRRRDVVVVNARKGYFAR